MTPYMYEQINAHAGLYNPSAVHSTNNAEVSFFERSLYDKIIAQFDVDIPDTWDRDYFLYTLVTFGFICVMPTDKWGVIPQWCTLQGYGIYYQPTDCSVHTNLINRDNMRIGRDCALIKLTPDYCGLWDIVHHYAEKLALISSSIDVNLMNSRVAYLLFADSKGNAETIKKALDRIYSGEPAVTVDSCLLRGPAGQEKFYEYSRDVKNSYIANQLLQDANSVMDEFCREVGIPTYDETKRERITTDEIHQSDSETKSRISVWLDCLKEGFRDANELFPEINISVKLRFGGETDVKNNVDRDVQLVR